MSTTPQYASTPKAATAVISTANTNRDGTGTLATLVTAGSQGTRIDDISIAATGTTTAGMVRFFLHDGTNARLVREVPVSAITPSSTVAAFASVLLNLAWIIPTGWSLRVSTALAESFAIVVTRAGDL